MTTKTTTRRRVLTGMAGSAVAGAGGAAMALPAFVGTQRPDGLPPGVQAVIADIRSLPASTPPKVYRVLQTVADLIESCQPGRAGTA